MGNEYEKLFYQEVREKRTTASGVHGLKGKRGLVGKMVTPADFSPRSYKAARDLGSFNMADFFKRLSEAPALRSVLLQRMDEEYKSYRMATEKTLDAVAELLQMALEPFRTTLVDLSCRLEQLEQMKGIATDGSGRGRAATGVAPVPGEGIAAPLPQQPPKNKPRIRWGASEEEIRQTVRDHARRLLQQGQDLTVSNIQKQVPSMLRYLYGERAVFAGLKGLIRDLEASEVEAAGQ